MATAIENQFHQIKARLQGSQFGHFMSWWFAELRAMLPARLQATMQHARRRVMVQPGDGDLAVSVIDGTDMQQLEVVSLSQDTRLSQHRVHDLLKEHELLECPRDVLLPEARVLRKIVVLPAAAETNLAQALTFEMDRQTPFRAADVFFDYRITQRERDAEQIKVELFVTPKQPLLNEMQLLAPLGLSPSGADVLLDGIPAGLNLLPADLRQRLVNSKSRANLILVAVLAGLLIVVMAQSLWLRQHQISEVQQAIDEVREEAMEVQQIRNRISDASEAAGFLRAQRAAALPTVEVLAEVTRILPDDTFLDRLLIGSDSVQMQGKSQNANGLIERVNASDLMTDAAFRGPTRLDSRTQKEIFDLTASLIVQGEE